MLTLIRGVPGSGKSTLARKLIVPGTLHYETDMWMRGDSGEYYFDHRKLGDCHANCLRAVRSSIEDGFDAVVSNTFIKQWELMPYINLAKEFNIPLQIIVCQGNFHNLHGVPAEKVAQMKEGFEW